MPTSFDATIPIRWGDMDSMGHVNNTIYFRLMEQARTEWFEHIGFPVQSTGDGIILAHTACDFLRPLTYPGHALVRQTLVRIGNSSMEIDYMIERDDEAGTAYAKGRAVIVWVNYASGKAVPWPAAVRERMA